jgi:hypothetical protein
MPHPPDRKELAAENWPKLRRVFANPRLQPAVIPNGGPSVLYPSRRKFIACPSASDIAIDVTLAASAAGAAESVVNVRAGRPAVEQLKVKIKLLPLTFMSTEGVASISTSTRTSMPVSRSMP